MQRKHKNLQVQMQRKQMDVDFICFLAVSFLCVLLEKANDWGNRSTPISRLFAFSPFIVFCCVGLALQDHFLFLSSAIILMFAVTVTGARDKLGSFLNSKVNAFLKELKDSLLKKIQRFKSSRVHKIIVTDDNFTSKILPVTLPPPRPGLAG